ncbi:MAG: hypothetical protein KME64_27445 [Scytonematopsis contorta HA4267-MV1]|jgi:hypothetical protein|nr:hypothetical protein [Scytonematopsis contorta HA4267-MV1]
MTSVLRVFLVKQILPLLRNLWLPHKKSAFSVKQATIGTVFTETSPKSDIRSLWSSKFLSKMSLPFEDESVKGCVRRRYQWH